MTLRQLMLTCADGYLCFEVCDASGRLIDNMIQYQAQVESVEPLDRIVRGWNVVRGRVVVVVEWENE